MSQSSTRVNRIMLTLTELICNYLNVIGRYGIDFCKLLQWKFNEILPIISKCTEE